MLEVDAGADLPAELAPPLTVCMRMRYTLSDPVRSALEDAGENRFRNLVWVGRSCSCQAVADVFVDGRSLAARLFENGYARRCDGSQGWCQCSDFAGWRRGRWAARATASRGGRRHRRGIARQPPATGRMNRAGGRCAGWRWRRSARRAQRRRTMLWRCTNAAWGAGAMTTTDETFVHATFGGRCGRSLYA